MTSTWRRSLACLAPLAVAAVGGLGSRRAPQVYGRLRKPGWAPPAAVFGPVWSGLYVLIGVAGYRMAGRPVGRITWWLHAGQLALNAAWPWAFFAGQDRRASLAVIAALDAAVAAETLLLARRDRTAAALLAPYLSWCLFATALNAAIESPRTS